MFGSINTSEETPVRSKGGNIQKQHDKPKPINVPQPDGKIALSSAEYQDHKTYLSLQDGCSEV